MISDPIYELNQHPSFYEGMSHTNINHGGKPFTPYVYKLSWTAHDMRYIGASYRAGCHPSHLWNKSIGNAGYFTSSAHVRGYIDQHGDPDQVSIVAFCSSMQEVKAHETMLLESVDGARNPKYLNKSNGDGEFVYDNSNNVVVFDKETGRSKRGKHVSREEYEANKDKYTTSGTGRCCFIDLNTNDLVYIDVSIARQHPDRYQTMNQGTVNVIDVNSGEPVRVTSEEYRANSASYYFHAEGKVSVRELATGNVIRVPTDEYKQHIGTKYESIMHGRTNVWSVESNEWVCVDVDEYRTNKHLYKTQSDFGITVIAIATGDYTRVTKEEYHVNKHLYTTNSVDKVHVFEIATNRKVSLDRDKFLENRHLYRTSVEGKTSHKSGKKSYVNHQGEVKFFPLGEAPQGWEQCQVLYSMDDGDAKMRPIRLKTEQPDKFHSGSNVFDLDRLEIRYLPKVIYSKDPSRYVSLRSPKYKEFKASQK